MIVILILGLYHKTIKTVPRKARVFVTVTDAYKVYYLWAWLGAYIHTLLPVYFDCLTSGYLQG
jgi:hypothetical protein